MFYRTEVSAQEARGCVQDLHHPDAGPYQSAHFGEKSMAYLVDNVGVTISTKPNPIMT